MSATDYRRIIEIENSNRFIGIECTDGRTVTMMIDGMGGYSPRLNADDVRQLVTALSDALGVMNE